MTSWRFNLKTIMMSTDVSLIAQRITIRKLVGENESLSTRADLIFLKMTVRVINYHRTRLIESHSKLHIDQLLLGPPDDIHY